MWTLTEGFRGAVLCTSTLLSVLWHSGTVQHLWAPKQACAPSHKMRVMLLAVTSQGKRDAPNGSQLQRKWFSWLSWDSPCMQRVGLPLFFLSCSFHLSLGGTRGITEGAPSFPTPMTPSPWMIQAGLGFAFRMVIRYKISSRMKFLLLIKAPFK